MNDCPDGQSPIAVESPSRIRKSDEGEELLDDEHVPLSKMLKQSN